MANRRVRMTALNGAPLNGHLGATFLGKMATVAFVLHAADASAQTPAQANTPTLPVVAPTPVAGGVYLNRFEPSERGNEFFAADALDFRGAVRPAIGFVLDYSARPSLMPEVERKVVGHVISDQVYGHLGASITGANRFRIGLSLPVQLTAVGKNLTEGDRTYLEPAAGAGFGDLRISADIRLFGEYGKGSTGALGLTGWAATGSDERYASSDTTRIEPHLSFAGEVPMDDAVPFVWAFRAGYRAHVARPSGSISREAHDIVTTTALAARLLKGKLTVGPEITANALFNGDADFLGLPIEAILGVHHQAGKQVRWGLGVGTGVTPTREFGAAMSPAVRVLGNLEWAPAFIPDTDKDGIADERDACPELRGIANEDLTKNGCPSDIDDDSIYDDVDACPETPGEASKDPKKHGCPADRDEDGIIDVDDACPKFAGPAHSDPAKNGCPRDEDADRIPDSLDACPKVAGIASKDPEKNGCPPDGDDDGVADADDACPDEKGVYDADPKKKGCPKARIVKSEIKILEQINFAFGKAELQGEGTFGVLESVRQILDAHPEIRNVRIEGHTDSRGSAVVNRKLSQLRAEAVATWLTNKGIDAARLVAEGFGPDRPLGENRTEAGRSKNRRVEFHIVTAPAAPAAGSAPVTKP